MTARSKLRGQKEAASSFCPFEFQVAPVESLLVAKVSIGVAGTSIGQSRYHRLPKAGFETGSPTSRVVDRTTELP